MMRRRQPLVGGRAASRRALRRALRRAGRDHVPPHPSDRHAHPCYAGDVGIGTNPKLLARIKAADLVLLIGGRLGEMPSQGYTLLDIPKPQPDAGARASRRRRARPRLPPDLAIHAAPTGFAAALEGLQPPNEIALARARPRRRMPTTSPGPRSRRRSPGRVNLGEVVVWLRDNLPADDASSPTAPAISRPGCIASTASASSPPSSAPTSGSMGYGLPAAVGAKRAHPERTVVSFAGDGDFLMNGQEFATAVQYGLPIIVVIVRQRHVRHHPHAPGARISRRA